MLLYMDDMYIAATWMKLQFKQLQPERMTKKDRTNGTFMTDKHSKYHFASYG